MFPTFFRIALLVCLLIFGLLCNNDNDDADDKMDPITDSGEFEGDITFPPGMNIWSYVKPDKNSGKGRSGSQESAIRSQHRIWPDGIIPYVISADFSRGERLVIEAAILEYYLETCIKWVKKSNEEDYVQFKKGKKCSSMVGKIGWRQDLILGPRCFQKGIVIHEMMHVIGFFHEQSRTDRDKYVKILFNNIIPRKKKNFEKYTIKEIDDLGTEYDCSSIMHYGPEAFSRKHGVKTIVSKSKECNNLGQRDTLSSIDIQDISLLYNCGNSNHKLTTPTIKATTTPATKVTTHPATKVVTPATVELRSPCWVTYYLQNGANNQHNWELSCGVRVMATADWSKFTAMGFGQYYEAGLRQEGNNKRFAYFSVSNYKDLVEAYSHGEEVEFTENRIKKNHQNMILKMMKKPLQWKENEDVRFIVKGEKGTEKWKTSCWYEYRGEIQYLGAFEQSDYVIHSLRGNKTFHSKIAFKGYSQKRSAEFFQPKIEGIFIQDARYWKYAFGSLRQTTGAKIGSKGVILWSGGYNPGVLKGMEHNTYFKLQNSEL